MRPVGLVLALSDAGLAELFEARKLVEPGLAALAAERIDDAAAAELRALRGGLAASALEDAEAFMWNDIELHARIARAADNAMLCAVAGFDREHGHREPAPHRAARRRCASRARRTIVEIAARHRGARRGGGQSGDAAPSGERRTGGERMIERPGKIVAIGLNYMDHVRESGAEPPKQPLVFASSRRRVIGDGERDPDPARAHRARATGRSSSPWSSASAARNVSEADALEATSAATRSPTTSPRATCSSPTASGCGPRAWTRSARSARRVVEIDDPQNLKLHHARQRRGRCRTPTRAR